MALETAGIHLFLFVFQLAGCVHLLRIANGRLYVSILATLLGVNGALSAVEAVAAVDPPAAFASEWLSTGGLLDLLTVPLLMGVLLARFTRLPPKAWLPVLATLAVAHVVAAAFFPDIRKGWPDLALRAGPYYLGLAVTAVLFARGGTSDRWLALAFLPRALYYGMFPVMDPSGLVGGDAVGMLNALGFLLLLAGALAAMLYLVRNPDPPRRSVVALVVAATIMLALVTTMAVGETRASLAVNFLSLGLVRPLFTYIALARDDLPAILGGSVVAGTAGIGALALGPAMSLPPLGIGLLAVSGVCLAFAGADAFLTRRARAPDRNEMPGAPHWMRVIVALQGSSAGGTPQAGWTQRGLAQRTGVGVRRVSEFPEALNATAARKLARHVPDWSPANPAPSARLVETFRGSVPGERGVIVYYRLTPLGERLAQAVARELDDPTVKIASPVHPDAADPR